MTSRTKFFVVVAALALGASGYFLLQNSSQGPAGFAPQANDAPQTTSSAVDASSRPASTANFPAKQSIITVTYTDRGFSPASVSVQKGDAVKFVNQSSEQMWVASDVHPSHTLYSGTTLREHCPDAANAAFDECGGASPGQSWTFAFTKTGVWKYHNHLDAGETGTVTVR